VATASLEVHAMRGSHILVVEDHFLIGEWLVQAMAGQGALVFGPVPTARDALRRLDESPIEGALLDVRLRAGVVTSVAKVLLERHIPFIVVTGYRRETLPPELKSAPYLPKPCQQAELIDLARRTFPPRPSVTYGDRPNA
jgi:DNA-binding NtrC family response regulator